MNPRVVATVAGGIMVLLGVSALVAPEVAMGFLGFAVAGTSAAARAYGEIRATYGGLPIVLGVVTLLAARTPAAHRGRFLIVGLLWLGVFSGRLIGVFVDGSPGLFGWVYLVGELALGGALVAASRSPDARTPAAV